MTTVKTDHGTYTGRSVDSTLFASLPLRVYQLSEACRQYEWADKAGDRWFYSEDGWCRETPFLECPMYCYDEVEVAKMYPCAGPFTRITGVEG